MIGDAHFRAPATNSCSYPLPTFKCLPLCDHEKKEICYLAWKKVTRFLFFCWNGRRSAWRGWEKNAYQSVLLCWHWRLRKIGFFLLKKTSLMNFSWKFTIFLSCFTCEMQQNIRAYKSTKLLHNIINIYNLVWKMSKIIYTCEAFFAKRFNIALGQYLS